MSRRCSSFSVGASWPTEKSVKPMTESASGRWATPRAVPVEEGAAALDRDVALLQERQIDDCERRTAILDQRERDAAQGAAAREVHRAVDRVEHPDRPCRRAVAPRPPPRGTGCRASARPAAPGRCARPRCRPTSRSRGPPWRRGRPCARDRAGAAGTPRRPRARPPAGPTPTPDRGGRRVMGRPVPRPTRDR